MSRRSSTRGRLALGFLVVYSMTGCVTRALQSETVAATRTLMEAENQQVLDNIARFVANPGAMPHFAVVSGGTFQMSDTLGVTPALGWNQFGLTSVMLGFNGQRNAANQWSLQPVYDPDKLKKMRCLYRYVTNPSNPNFCLDCNEYFAALSTTAKTATPLTTATAHVNDGCGVPTGFYRCGRKCDVPACACYVAQCGDVNVWVEPSGLDGLTRLTLLVLDLATAQPAQTKTTTKSTKAAVTEKGLGAAPGQVQETTEETTTGGRMQFEPGAFQFTK
jgi:hypothetical protein